VLTHAGKASQNVESYCDWEALTMHRHISITHSLLAALLLLALPAFAAEPTEDKAPAAVPLGGTVTSVDAEARTIEVQLRQPFEGQTSKLFQVPPDAQIYRQSEVTAEDIALGDMLEVRSIPPSLPELTPEYLADNFPPRMLSFFGDVVALQPLKLTVGKSTTITLPDTSDLELNRWQKITLAQVKTDDIIGLISQQGENALVAKWIRLWPSPFPEIHVLPAPPPKEQP
jgi:hypothetical protein